MKEGIRSPVDNSLKHRGQVEHAPRGAGLGGAHQHTFCSHLKMRFKQIAYLDERMPKNVYFWNENLKITSVSGAPPPNPCLLLGAGSPQTLTLLVLLLLSIASLSSSFLALNAFYSPQKKELK